MRVAHLTGGTGGFFCGTCIRDNALVVALQALGHDAFVVPLYMPVVAEGPDASAGIPLFFGGINVFLQEHSALFRWLPRWVDRVLDSPSLLRLLSKRASATQAEGLGEITVSMLGGPSGRQAKEVRRLMDWLCADPPDVVVVSNSLLAGVVPAIKARLGVPVVVTLQGEMHFVDALGRGRGRAWVELSGRLREADAVVAVSGFCADEMAARTGLERSEIVVVAPGVAVASFPARGDTPQMPSLGYLARLSDEKGLALVVDAFIELHRRQPGRELRLQMAGTTRGGFEGFLAGLLRRLECAGLGELSSLTPDLTPEAKRRFLREQTVFCVPGRPGETSALSTLEAMAVGVPVVAVPRGALPELMAKTGAGLMPDSDSAVAIADAVEALLVDPVLAQRLGEQGREAVRRWFSAEQMALGMLAVMEGVAESGGGS